MRIVVVLVLIIASISACGMTDQPRFPTAAPSPTSTRPQPTLAPPAASATMPTSNPDLFILDTAFADTKHGWLLADSNESNGTTIGTGDYHLALRITTDGGYMWSPIPSPVTMENSGTMRVQQATRMRFSDSQNGWLFSPGFFSTHDGGMTWTDEHRMIVTLEPKGQSVWGIEQRGQARVLIISHDAGHTWIDNPNQPPGLSDAQLARVDERNAYLLGSPMQRGEITIFKTSDAGTTWESITDPTSGKCWTANRIVAAPDNSLLWLFCGSQPATDMQAKTLYASTDRGTHWTVIADDGFLNRPQIGQFNLIGYLVDGNRDGSLVMVSSTLGFIAPSRGTLSRTQDGGHSWQQSIPDTRVIATFVGPIRFTDPLHIWVPAIRNNLFITTNGGDTWDDVTVA